MRITGVRTELLRIPLQRPMQAASSTGKKGGPVDKVNMPIIFITTCGTASPGVLSFPKARTKDAKRRR